ncbi:MAG: hypothetical protein KAY50_00430 [Chitinophagaceae bacterium]|nr:hypothetical protein [Chitinophagaceae bacterium]
MKHSVVKATIWGPGWAGNVSGYQYGCTGQSRRDNPLEQLIRIMQQLYEKGLGESREFN